VLESVPGRHPGGNAGPMSALPDLLDAPAVGASARECAAVGLRSDGDARGRCKGDVTGDMTLGEFKSCDTSDSDRATRRE